jgi:hypothetical protein
VGGKNESKALNMSKHKSFKGRKENCFWAKQEGKRRQVTHRRQVVNSEKEKKTGGEKGDECYSSPGERKFCFV